MLRKNSHQDHPSRYRWITCEDASPTQPPKLPPLQMTARRFQECRGKLPQRLPDRPNTGRVACACTYWCKRANHTQPRGYARTRHPSSESLLVSKLGATRWAIQGSESVALRRACRTSEPQPCARRELGRRAREVGRRFIAQPGRLALALARRSVAGNRRKASAGLVEYLAEPQR